MQRILPKAENGYRARYSMVEHRQPRNILTPVAENAMEYSVPSDLSLTYVCAHGPKGQDWLPGRQRGAGRDNMNDMKMPLLCHADPSWTRRTTVPYTSVVHLASKCNSVGETARDFMRLGRVWWIFRTRVCGRFGINGGIPTFRLSWHTGKWGVNGVYLSLFTT